MSTWTRTAGLLFLAAASVYSNPVTLADEQTGASPAKQVKNDAPDKGDTAGVKQLEDSTDPFAANSGATTKPAGSEGKSVSASEVNVSDAGQVEIHVNDANLIEVLRMLSLQSQKNIVASKEVRGTVTANLYDVTVREALDAILHANGYAYREQGNFIYVYTEKELADKQKSERHVTTEAFRVYYTPAANAVNMIKPVLSTEAVVAFTTPAKAGIEESAKDAGGNDHAADDLLVVTDYPDNLERVRKILKEVDRRPEQILIEATILSASLTEDNALGVDFTILGSADFASLTNAGSSTGAALSGNIVNQPGTGHITDHGYGAAGTGFTNNVPAGGMRVGFVKNNVAVFLQALESVTNTTVLANPKVLALNKQKGQVIVGRKDGYITTTVSETSSTQTVNFLETGVKLLFRPYIGDDGYVRMEIHPEDSSGGLTSANLPFSVTTEVTTNVMVKDGHTIVIGGLFRESNDTSRDQVPFLGNLPLAGPLFRQQRDRTQREEVIILLTPHIIKDEKVYSDASEKELKEAEKLRVGTRRGMMPFGRERLAEAEYEKAVAEMNKPEPDRQKALWHLDCATNLNPTFREAIDMKQSISGKEITMVDNSSIRGFLRRQMIDDAGPRNAAPAIVPIDPATRPADRASRPSTQPVEMRADVIELNKAATQPVAAAPTTMPAVATVATTQPIDEAMAEDAATESTDAVSKSDQPDADKLIENRESATAEAATTQPASEGATVTELPMECAVEAPAGPESAAPVESSKSTVTELPLEEALQDISKAPSNSRVASKPTEQAANEPKKQETRFDVHATFTFTKQRLVDGQEESKEATAQSSPTKEQSHEQSTAEVDPSEQ